MIFFFKADGALIKSAPDIVYQGSAEAGKIYVVMPFNANAVADVYFRLPNGENWGPYVLSNNGVVADGADMPTGWGLWSLDLESAITQYAGTLTAQFGFYQSSGDTKKVPLITTQGVTITIAKGVVRDLPEQPTDDIYEQILAAISEINQDISGMGEHYLQRTDSDAIALKNNGFIGYSTSAAPNVVALRDANGRLKAADGVSDDDLATVKQLNESETDLQGKIDSKLDKNAADTLFVKKEQLAAPFLYAGGANGDTIAYLSQTPNAFNVPQYTSAGTLAVEAPVNDNDAANKQWTEAQIAAAHTSVYTYKGSKDTYDNLPSAGNKVGDVWNVEDTGINYAWNGVDWDSLSASVLQSTGNSTIQAMSQKAVTDELNKKTSQEVFVSNKQPTSADARIWVDTSISVSALSKIYGVDKVGQSNPTLTRTDSAVGLTYTIGQSEIKSDFDKCYPWSEMKEVTDNYGNAFIRVPKFYTKITQNDDGTYKHQISGIQHEGFSTLFVDGKGNELDYILIGKYEGSAVVSGDVNYDSAAQKVKSKSGQTVLVNTTRGTYRTRCRNVGKGYQQYDFMIDAIIKELFMIEFATTNSQSIMYGYTNNNTAAIATGRTDTVKTSSGSEVSNTDGKHACKYRGIENPFGNVWKLCDGINFDAKKIYVCEDPEFYADNKYDAPYTYMGDRLMSEDYLKEVTPFAKNPLLGYATAIGAGSTTHYSDYYYVNNTGTVLYCGGRWLNGAFAGLWFWAGSIDASYESSNIGGRLCYKPIRN